MQQLGLQLRDHAAEIRELWIQVIQEPPLRLPPEHDLGPLPAIIYDLIEVSLLHPLDMKFHEHKIVAALEHGERRRAAGFEERIIYEEFAALREAIRRYVAVCAVPRWKAREALIRLDMAISVAELAAVHGYNRELFEQIGKWTELPRQLARQSPLLDLPLPPA